MNEVKWNEHFKIGVDLIDNAHKRLFSIVNKLISLTEDTEKQQHACREGIKYLKNYTAKHFAEEEAYMRLIDYKDYAIHKSLHDTMQNQTIPVLEQELEKHNYSEESIQHFLGMCIGWLNCHIMIEDFAISGRAPHKWLHEPAEDQLSSLKKAVRQTFYDLFRTEATIVTTHYSGENFSSGATLCYRLSYRMENGGERLVFMVYEEALVLKLLSDMLGRQIAKIDPTIVEAMKIISQKIMNCIRSHFPPDSYYEFEKINTLSFEQLVHSFDRQYPSFSLLLSAEGDHYFALCIK